MNHYLSHSDYLTNKVAQLEGLVGLDLKKGQGVRKQTFAIFTDSITELTRPDRG